MKLFTKEIDNKLFDQYTKGSDLENQKVVAKIFNPYGRGTWYLLNSDPQDPDYIWAIVDLFEVEMGSVSRSELESIKVPPFGLGLERDLSFTPINAYELYMGLLNGKQYAEGGMMSDNTFDNILMDYGFKKTKTFSGIRFFSNEKNKDIFASVDDKLKEVRVENNDNTIYSGYSITDLMYILKKNKNLFSEKTMMANSGQTTLFEEGGNVAQQNKEMLKNQAREFTHHSKELNSLIDKTKQVDAWVVAKAERASTDLSDITHYLDGRIMAKGGNLISIKEIEKEYKENENNNLHSENVVLLAENFGTDEELSEAKDILKQHEEQGSLSTELYNRRSVLEDILWKKFQTMKKVVMAKGGVTTKFKVGDKVKIDYISDYNKHNGEIGKITWLNEAKYYPNGDYSVVEKRTQAEITYKDGSTEMISDLYTKGSGLVSPVKKIKEDGGMMAKGGATFKDKVNAISKRLEGTKVPTRLKKDYGATYDKKEAKQAGQRIAGSMIQKLKMRNK